MERIMGRLKPGRNTYRGRICGLKTSVRVRGVSAPFHEQHWPVARRKEERLWNQPVLVSKMVAAPRPIHHPLALTSALCKHLSEALSGHRSLLSLQMGMARCAQG